MNKDMRVLWPVRWRIGFYTAVRWVRAGDGEEARQLVAEWCIATMPQLIKLHGIADILPEHRA